VAPTGTPKAPLALAPNPKATVFVPLAELLPPIETAPVPLALAGFAPVPSPPPMAML
jgi:hypothetical protein